MRFLRPFIIAWAMLICVGASASAQNVPLLGILTEHTRTMEALMLREKCPSEWLSQVLDDNGIDSSQMSALPVGQKIFFDNETCKKTPPASVVAKSEKILAIQKLLKRPKPPPPVVVEVVKPATPEPERPEPQAQPIAKAVSPDQVAGLTHANDDLRKQLSEMEKKIAEAKKGLFIWWWLVVAGLAGLALGLAMLVSVLSWRNRKMVRFRRKPAIRYKGEKYIFLWVGVGPDDHGRMLGLHKCPRCGKADILGRKEHFRKHLDRCTRLAGMTIEFDQRLDNKESA